MGILIVGIWIRVLGSSVCINLYIIITSACYGTNGGDISMEGYRGP